MMDDNDDIAVSGKAEKAVKAAAEAEDKRAKFFDDFFRLKKKYEENNRLRARKAMKKKESDSSSLEDKDGATAPIALCVQCGKPGGTLFSIHKDRYLAICRATGKKCNLHMELRRGHYLPTRELFFEYKNILDRARENIIVMKNNVEFEYEEADSRAYREENAHYESTRKLLDALREHMADSVREAEERKLTNDLLDVIGKTRASGKTSASSGKTSASAGETQNATEEETIDFIENYRDKILPLVEQIRNVKYRFTEMRTDNGANLTRVNHCKKTSSWSGNTAEMHVLFQQRNFDEINFKGGTRAN